MPKFKTVTLTNRNKADGVLQRSFDVHIDSEGEFYVNLPEDMLVGVDNTIPKRTSLRAGQTRTCIVSSTYQGLEGYLSKILANINAVHVTEEPVIRYNIESQVSFGLDEEGAIVPNGLYAKTKGHCVWLPKDESQKFGSLHATNTIQGGYLLKIGARAQVKTTYTYGCSQKISYHDYYGGGSHHGIENPAQRLNSWVGFRLPDNAKEIHYSDDAAQFFFELMMGMAKLSKLIQDSTFDSEQLLRTIAQSKSPLLGFDLSASPEINNN